MKLPIYIQLNLFDGVVSPIILQSCEVWGFSNIYPLENLHVKYCKMLLEFRYSTPNVMNYGETGIFHFKVIIKERMIKYWSGKILGKEEKNSYIA